MTLNTGSPISSLRTAGANRPKLRAPRRLKFRTAAAIGAVLTVSALAPSTKADTVTWTGLGDGVNWSSTNNWFDTTTLSAQVPAAADNVLNATGTAITLNIGATINSFSSATGGLFTVANGFNANNPGVSTFDNSGGVQIAGGSFSGFVVGSGTTITATYNGSNQLNNTTINGLLDMSTQSYLITHNGLTINGQVNLGNSTYFRADGDQTYGGNGKITFEASGGALLFANSDTITIGSGITVDGTAGQLQGNFANQGLISSDAGGQILLNGSTYTNTGTLEATGAGSTLQIASATVNGGALHVANGGVIVDNGSIYSGTDLTGAGKYTFAYNASNNLNGITVSSASTLDLASTASYVITHDGMTLNGQVNLDNSSIFRADGDQTYQGSGSINFGSAGSTLWANSDTITIGSGITVQGINGTLQGNFVNSGLINSNGGGILTLSGSTYTNNTTIEATNNSNVTINSANINGGNLSATAGSTITNNASAYNGTTLTGGGAFLFSYSANNVLTSNVVTAGTTMDLASTSSYIITHNGLTLDGTVNLNNNSTFRADGDQTYGGSGNIVFGDGTGGVGLLWANSDTITIGNNLTVEGKNGELQGDFINNGLITSNGGGQFLLNGSTYTNNATIQATNNSSVLVSSATINGGNLDATAGSSFISDASVYNGTNLTGGGTFTFNYSASNNLNNVTVAANTLLDLASTQSYLITHDGLTDNGTINLNENSVFRADGDQTYSGNGKIVFGDGTGGDGTLWANSDVVTIDNNLTVEGKNGTIQGAFVNNGLITSNGGGQFYFTDGTITNNATVQATNNSSIFLNGSTVNGGSLNITGGSTLISSGATINGSNINGGGTVTFNYSAANLLNGVTVGSGILLDLGSAASYLITHNGLTLNGQVNLDNASVFRADGDQTYSGTGKFTFGSAGATLWANSDTVILGSGLTIDGNNGTMQGNFINDGKVSADVAGGTITVTQGITNHGTLEAINGGALVVNGDINSDGIVNVNGSGGFAPSNVGLSNSSITVNSGHGMVNINGGALTGGGTINGNVNIGTGGTISPGDPQIMTINGNYNQTGTYMEEIAGNGTGAAGNNPNGFDQINISGTGSLGGTLDVDPLNASTLEAELASNHPLTFDIINATGGLSGGYTLELDPSLAGWTVNDSFSIVNGDEGILTIDGLTGPTLPVGPTGTPEPGTLGLFAGLMTSGAFFYRRRRRN